MEFSNGDVRFSLTKRRKESRSVVNVRRISAYGAMCGLVVGSLVTVALPASAAPVTVTIHHADEFVPFDLSASDGDTVATLKTLIAAHTGPTSYPDTCLVHSGTLMQPADTLATYGVVTGDTIDAYALPLTTHGTWDITPDDPFVGNQIGMTPISHPLPTHVTLVSGALPSGASLNPSTGNITGSFDTPGPFSATLRMTTVCGDWDLTWSGDVTYRLPNTGANAAGIGATFAVGILALLAGIVAVVWRRRARAHS